MSQSSTATLPGDGKTLTSPPSAWPWDRPTIADLVFVVVALMVLRGAARGLLDDPGLGWHLRNLDAMWAQKGWLTTDPFTLPRADGPRTWYTNQWLGEVPFYLGWRLAGLEGIAIAAALILALLSRCLYVMLLRDGLPWPMAVLWTALGTVGASCSWVARPNLFTLLFVLLTARVCERYHAGQFSLRRAFWLVPLFAVWANTHGGFLAGFILLVATLLVEMAIAVGGLSAEERALARKRASGLLLLTGACWLATLVNPYSWKLYAWTFQLLGDKYFMELHQEWKSPDFHSAGAMRYELLLLLFPLVLALTSRRPNMVELGLSVLWLHFALTGYRYMALWVVVVIPLLGRSSMGISYLQDLAKRLELTTQPGSLFATRAGSPPWLWTAIFAVALVGAGGMLRGQFAGHGKNILATRALDRLLELQAKWQEKHGRAPVIFHSYDWGGYLTWHGWPGVLNWIDDRNEVQGKERVEKEYFAILRADPGWEKKLAGVDFVCIQPDAPLVARLREKPTVWKEVDGDKPAVTFERIGR